jgi:NAD(P)H-hydrate epimerase
MSTQEVPPLPARPVDGHKGTFGHVLIVGGSRGMSGAAALAGCSALRGGAGLTTVAAPASVVPIIAAIEPSYLTLPLPEDDDGRIASTALPAILKRCESVDVVAIGPGWGKSADLRQLAATLYTQLGRPLVVDADALNALARRPDLLNQHAGPRVLTPHPGEFARLTGSDTKSVQSHREVLARDFAAQHNVVLVLKGRHTITTDGQALFVNQTGNSGLATGGTGDVLTGLIAALIAQKLSPLDAARTGVYLHGLAGDLAVAELSEPGLITSDLPRYLCHAWRAVLQNRQDQEGRT